MHEHYHSAYLDSTAKIASGVKEHSYDLFAETRSGTIIDLGCGTGLDVIQMAECLNGVKVIGIDHDADMIEAARKNALEKLVHDQVEFVCSPADSIPYPDSSIEGIRAERLMQHVTNEVEVYREVYRVLKKGGVLVFLETDWCGLSIHTPHLDIERKIISYLTEAKINNAIAAKNLYGSLRQGFRSIRIEAFPFTFTTLKEANKYLILQTMVDEMKEKKFLNLDEYSMFNDTIREFDDADCFFCTINLLVASALKK